MVTDSLVTNDIGKDSAGVWSVGKHGLTGSPCSTPLQRYLEDVLGKCSDPGSDSRELDRFIRDRDTEYHLSSLRPNLLRALRFNPDVNVLEIGCECGAITRFLGENCRSVVGIENNPGNAQLARLRTRNQGNVEILCASPDEINFIRKFDIIIYLGLFENTTLPGTPDSLAEKIIKQLASLLAEDGVLLLAADNPSGLVRLSATEKSSFQELLETMRISMENRNIQRPCHPEELMALLQPHFDRLDLLFPYPDYRLTECVLSAEMIRKVSAGELLGNFRSSKPDNAGDSFFNEKLALLELDKKKLLPSFANSFLLIAGQKNNSPVGMDGLGTIFSKGRVRELQAVTRFISSDGAGIKAVKTASHRSPVVAGGKLRLIEGETDWTSGYSLQLELLLLMTGPEMSLEKLFSPVKPWLACMRAHAVRKNGRLLLNGGFIDHIWKNCFLNNQQCNFIDREWEWGEYIPINTLLVRSIFLFLKDAIEIPGAPTFLTENSARRIISKIAHTLDIELTNRDFNDFCQQEAEFQSLVYGRSTILNSFEIKLILWNRSVYNGLGKLKRILLRAAG